MTTCALATKALELLRANKDVYDLVISDVHMPDMDGFKLLELVGLEMDLPVISKDWLLFPFDGRRGLEPCVLSLCSKGMTVY